MLKDNINKALNEQINKEFFSEFLYLSMAAWFSGQNLNGFANWYDIQAREEHDHGMKIFNYVLERGGMVELSGMEKPTVDFQTAENAVKMQLSHEHFITDSINKVMDLSIEVRDHATRNMLDWFVEEQVEEEANAEDILAKLQRLREHPNGLYMLDKELGTRVYTPPATTAK